MVLGLAAPGSPGDAAADPGPILELLDILKLSWTVNLASVKVAHVQTPRFSSPEDRHTHDKMGEAWYQLAVAF